MIVGTVVLCPAVSGPDPYDRAGVAEALCDSGVVVLAPDLPPALPGDDRRTQAAHYVARLALAITAAAAPGPVLPVLPGEAGVLAPAVGLSQRAARRAVAGYVLVDATRPAPTGEVPDWPDAPIAYLAGPGAPADVLNHARLRDWRLTRLADLAVPHVAQALQDLLG